MKQTHRGGDTPPPGIQIEQHELGKNEMVMIFASAATLVLAVVLGIVAIQIATGIKWALILLAGGLGLGNCAYLSLTGAGHFVRMRLEGLALLERAKGRNLAEITAVRRGLLLPPGEM